MHFVVSSSIERNKCKSTTNERKEKKKVFVALIKEMSRNVFGFGSLI
jgi:hypothetical protein